jgi:lipopolysaccharide/colanic/teichoic acid biosynthesis glycosyltransferase
VAKRIFDLFFSCLGLTVLLPFFLIIALIIKLDSPGSVFYRQTRIGRNGKPFRIFKFRTMVSDADRMGKHITVSGDSRITASGRFLRKCKADELPQLINVLIGEMSFVGPRPEVQEYVDLYTPEQREVLTLCPGITDYASLRFRNENDLLEDAENAEKFYIEKIMPYKLNLNLEYARKHSLWTDIKLIFATVFSVVGIGTAEEVKAEDL